MYTRTPNHKTLTALLRHPVARSCDHAARADAFRHFLDGPQCGIDFSLLAVGEVGMREWGREGRVGLMGR